MYRQNEISRVIAVFGAFLLLAVLTTTGYAIEPGGGIPPRSCNFSQNYGTIGDVSADLGESAAVPVYIDADSCIDHFHFEFFLDENLNFDSVQMDNWPYGIDPDMPDWDPETRKLIVERQGGTGCYTPTGSEVFFYIWVNTHCSEVQDVELPIGWNEISSANYVSYASCDGDEFEGLTDGSVYINPIVINFDITDNTGLIGEDVTVTVTCENDFLFENFVHYIQYDNTVLEAISPVMVPGPRTDGYISVMAIGNFIIINADPKPGGFGTSGDGLDFYDLTFRIISPVDDVTGAICFITEGTGVWALDCSQPLHEFATINHDCGSVTVPAYRAEFDLGEVIWSNNNTCEFRVPLYLDNNYPVYKFNLAVQYTSGLFDPLNFIGIESDYGFQAAGYDCWDPGRGDWEFALLTFMATEPTVIHPGEGPRLVGNLVFASSTPNPGTYPLDFLEFGCDGDFETWVKTWDEVRGETRYSWADPRSSFVNGMIEFVDPLVDISTSNAYAAVHCDKWGNCDYDNWAFTSLSVKSNVDMDELTFLVSWSPDEFCVTEENLPANVQVTIDDDECEALVTISDIERSLDWQWFGTLRFENASYAEQWGTMDVTDINVTEPCASEDPPPTQGAGGQIHLYATSLAQQTCRSVYTPPIRKEAGVPLRFALAQNHPNPFNASTRIEFVLPEAGYATLAVYNVMGQRVVTLLDGHREAGSQSIIWDGRDTQGRTIASGIYFYRLQSGLRVETRKMVLMK